MEHSRYGAADAIVDTGYGTVMAGLFVFIAAPFLALAIVLASPFLVVTALVLWWKAGHNLAAVPIVYRQCRDALKPAAEGRHLP